MVGRLKLTSGGVLSKHTEARRLPEFERAMQEMAADPQIQAEYRAIDRDFAKPDSDMKRRRHAPAIRSTSR